MKAYIFPGQGAQYPGMGKELYDSSARAKALFDQANEILGFRITDIMFEGDADALKATKVTQPAVFLHSVVAALCSDLPAPNMVAGHSLGEFSALVVSGALTFEDGLRLVSLRAQAMQKACDLNPGSMAAIIAADPDLLERICNEIPGIVIPANYNSEVQTVISGETPAVESAVAALKEAGVRKCVMLQVGGAFHSPLMEPARVELAGAIDKAPFAKPLCPIYQNVDALPNIDPDKIKSNLLMQLTSPVRWVDIVRNMVADGATHFTEIGPGNVLQGLIKKTAPEVELFSIA
ncbi:MAG: ACP S-malonyltransferase [Bacteroidales bacterium]|nr:ACP S-malonyltransferase [Bacteroidales bacterium]